MPSWDATHYLQFMEQRTQPCRDLASRVPVDSPGRVIDLGCGPGNSTAILRKRWPKASIVGLDDSAEMIELASKSDSSVQWQLGDISKWAAAELSATFDVVFSNAALQWVPDHETLYPRLMERLSRGGFLAVQVPGNMDAPAHEAMRRLAASSKWKQRIPAGGVREWRVLTLEEYYDLVAPLAKSIDLCQTEYLHILPDAEAIVEWYKGTGLRPFLDALASDEQRNEFVADYFDEIRQECLPRRDGRVLFPFRRYFLLAAR
jgi:trans-aconitate 2-methyltransferase